MATVAHEPVKPAASAQAWRARAFGGVLAISLVSIAVTLIGFWRTFFARLLETDFAHHLHGWTATGWLVLVLVQASLIRSRKHQLHRSLGWASIAFFIALLASGWHMMALMLSGKTHVPFEWGKLFVFSDIIMVPLMVIAYVTAIVKRRDRHVHSRLMAVTLLAGLLPAVARMFNLVFTGPEGLVFAMHPSFLFLLAILGAAMWSDWRKGGLRWPFPFAFAWITIAYAGLFPGAGSQWFDIVARWMGSTV